MKHPGVFLLFVIIGITSNSCTVPSSNEIDANHFFFGPQAVSQSASFLPVRDPKPKISAPPASNQHCLADRGSGKSGTTCWFFPVMRIY